MKRIKTNLREIEESEQWYQQILGNAHDAIAILDEKNKIEYCNRQFLRLTEYDYEELIGIELTKLMNGWNRVEMIKDRIQSSGLGEETLIPVTEVFQKSGETRKVEVNATQFLLSTGNAHAIIYLKDITRALQMEERLIESERLRTLGEMASSVAHNFNNALSAVLGHTQLLLYTVNDEDLKETLMTIEKVTKDSAKIVHRLQDFTRKGTREELHKLDLNTIIKDTVEITKPKWKDEVQGRGIQIAMVFNLKEIPLVTGDPSSLREVCINLIFNAVEAMPEGGKIEIQTFQEQKKVYLQISDTGIGISEEVKQKIFEPFFTTKPLTNSGLGLSTSYEIIKRLGGKIEVESKVGFGTTFTISLPMGLEGKEEFKPPPMIKKRKEGRILVVDDEESVRNALTKMLKRVSHEVISAENGQEGIRLFREKEFDMVLTDLGMPGISGWEFCEAIKKINPHIPVGMVTGWGIELDRAKIEESGLDFIISKPFDFNQLLNVVFEKMEFKGKELLT